VASPRRPALRTHRFVLLVSKEFRELLASRAFWLLLMFIGPLVGHGFVTAVDAYAEASGSGGGPAALAQGLSPLDGILVPAWGAYDLAVTFLFPFVAIRLVASEKASGAWKVLVQSPLSPWMMMAAKGVALAGGWLVAWIPGMAALGLWRMYGGALYAPEVMNLLLGHALRATVAAGVAVAAATVANGAATAAIATLGFTVGTWALEFVATGRGGALEKAALYTPAAALRAFERGELPVATALVTGALGAAGFAVAAVWLHQGRPPRRRMAGAAAVVLALGAAIAGASQVRVAWDMSENRRNSFSRADEAALAGTRQPLRVTVYLAPEDPRLADLERNILSKLARILPEVEIVRAAHSRAGLFAGPGEHYGEVWYALGGHSAMTRSTTEAIVLDNLYRLAGVAPPVRGEAEFPGHPLPAAPRGAAWLFYAVWPVAVAGAGWLRLRNGS